MKKHVSILIYVLITGILLCSLTACNVNGGKEQTESTSESLEIAKALQSELEYSNGDSEFSDSDYSKKSGQAVTNKDKGRDGYGVSSKLQSDVSIVENGSFGITSSPNEDEKSRTNNGVSNLPSDYDEKLDGDWLGSEAIYLPEAP